MVATFYIVLCDCTGYMVTYSKNKKKDRYKQESKGRSLGKETKGKETSYLFLASLRQRPKKSY